MSLVNPITITICLEIIELSNVHNFEGSIYLSQNENYTIEQIDLSISFDELWNIIDRYVYNKRRFHPVPFGNNKLWGRNVGQQKMIDNVERDREPCISIDVDNFDNYKNDNILLDQFGGHYMELAVVIDSNQNNEDNLGINLQQQSATKRQKVSDCSFGGSNIDKYQTRIQSDINDIHQLTGNELKSKLNQLGVPADGTIDELKTRLFRELCVMPTEDEIEFNSDDEDR